MPNIQSRYLSLSSMRQVIGSGKPPAEAPVAASGAPSNANSAGEGVRPSNFEKKMLVWTKKYKAEAEIPETLRFVDIAIMNIGRPFHCRIVLISTASKQ